MTPGEEKKLETPQSAPEKKESPKKSDSTWETIKTKFGKAFDALRDGFKKDGSVFDKLAAIPSFFKAFWEDVKVVETEEDKNQRKTAAETGAVLKNLDPASAVSALAPAFAVTDKDGKVQETPAVVNDVVSVAYDAARSLDTDRKKSKTANEGETMGVLAQIADKVDPKKNPDKKPLSTDDQKLAFGFGAEFARAMKEKYPDKANFKKALDDFEKSTAGAQIGFQTFRTETFKGLFKEGDKLKIFDPILDKLGWIAKGKLATGLLSGTLVADLKTGKIPDTLVEASAKILPSTSVTDRTNLLKTVGQILAQKELGATFPTNDQLTNIVFSVSDPDLEKLSTALAA